MIIAVGIGVFCLSCLGDQDPVQPRGRPVEVQVEQAIPDGCARFQIHANPGATVTVDSIYGTQYCQTDELKLIQDSAAVFDVATGKLRVPIVVKNVGTRAVRGLLKIRYDADSVQLFDASGNPVPGPTTTVGLGDSTLNNGRVAYWAYNQLLAPPGQLQVLFSGQTSGRRWLELQGTDWNHTVKLKLFTTARYETVPSLAPDTVPSWFEDDSNFVTLPAVGSLPFRRDVVVVYFKRAATAADRAAAIELVGGAVVGGQRISSDGAYFVQLPPDSTHQRPFAAVKMLSTLPSVSAAILQVRFAGPGVWKKPFDGLGRQRTDYQIYAESAYAPHPFHATWALEAIRAPLAWGCSIGDSLTRVAVIDQGLHYTGMQDLSRNKGDTSGVDIAGFSWQHGTAVAMVLAARGNDSSQMSGVTWRARLELRE
ncbi:MAG: hypothetical protein U0163_01365, partial [Gemmatimonadaceae bacterium]